MSRILALADALLERVLGQPVTGRCASVDFGPPPGAVHAERLANFPDSELINGTVVPEIMTKAGTRA